MRIKLRLYERDLDLISLKQNPNFAFNNVLRQALVEYVRTGHCDRVAVPEHSGKVILQNEQIDWSLNDELYADVIEWILSLRDGMRSNAIKSVLRSAIENPALSIYKKDSELVIPQIDKLTTKNPYFDRMEKPQKPAEKDESESPGVVTQVHEEARAELKEKPKEKVKEEPNEEPHAESVTTSEPEEEVLDLFENAFFDEY